MYDIIISFITGCLEGMCRQFVEFLAGLAEDIFRSAFRIETWSGLDATVLSTLVVSRMLAALYGIMVLLLALKLIWKGFKVYVLWRDGESETSPVELLGGSVFALVTAMAFPLLYDIAVDIVMEIGDTLLQYTGWAVFSIDTGGLQLIADATTIAAMACPLVAALLWIFFSIARQAAQDEPTEKKWNKCMRGAIIFGVAGCLGSGLISAISSYFAG